MNRVHFVPPTVHLVPAMLVVLVVAWWCAAHAQPAAAPASALASALASGPASALASGPARGEQRVRIIWFGNTGGVSGLGVRSDAHERLFEFVGDGLEALAPRGEGPRAFAHGGRIVYRPGGLPVPLLARLLDGLHGRAPTAAGAPRRERVSDRFPMLVGPFEEVFEHPPGAETPVLDLLDGRLPGAERVFGRLWRFVLADGDTVWMAEAPGVDAEAPLAADPLDWEVRFLWEAEATPPGGAEARRVFKVDRPVNEGARRAAAVRRLAADVAPPALVLAAGNDLESFSFLDSGVADEQRANSWTALSRMGLALLAPGAAELAFGAPALAAEAQAAGVPVSSASLREQPFAPWVLRAVGPVQVLLVGLTDAAAAPPGGPPPRAPADAVRGAIVAARAELGRRPDLVVGVGVLSPQARAELVTQRTALDLLLTDFEDRGVAPETVRTAVGGAGNEAENEALRRRAHQPLSLVATGRHRLGVADVWLRPAGSGWRVDRVDSQALPVLADEPADADLLRAVQAVRQPAFARAQRRLLPDVGPIIDAEPELHALFRADPLVRRGGRFGWRVPGRLTEVLWRRLVVHALRAEYATELAVLPLTPFPWPLAGPVSRLQAAANLNVPDTLAVMDLSARKLRLLARSPRLAELAVAGLDASNPDLPKVGGRDVVDRERYRVLVSAELRTDLRFVGLLDDPADPAPWRGVSVGTPASGASRVGASSVGAAAAPSAPGAPVGPPLRDAAIEALAGAHEDPARLTSWMLGRVPVATRWVLDLRELSVGTSNYGTYGPRTPYAGVRETRVTTGANVTTVLRADLGLRREGDALEWLNRARLDFAKANYDEGEDQETADQIIVDTELRFRALRFRTPFFGADTDITPYTTVQFATEFTPTTRVDAATGATVENRRKARLEGALGLVYKPGFVDELRLAALVGQDFAERDDDPQVGALFGLKLDRDFEVVRWKNEIDLRAYLPGVGVDSATELGAVLRARTSLDLPVFAGIGIGVYLDVFGYLGTSASTRDPGASLIAGAQLTFDRLFKLAWAE